MYTVIICPQHIITDCQKKYHLYLKPFIDSNQFVFCEWNPYGKTLDETLPNLRDVIRNVSKWNALVIVDATIYSIEQLSKQNPFNYIDCEKTPFHFDDYQQVLTYRQETEAKMNQAFENPLVKLSNWLLGISFRNFISDFNTLDINCLNETNYFEQLEAEQIDPVDLEVDLANQKRYKRLTQTFLENGELFNPPQSLLTLMIRTKESSFKQEQDAWNEHEEYDYTNFFYENLYHERMRYLLSDIPYINGRMDEIEYFRLLTLAMVLASNDIPNNIVKAYRVYHVEVHINQQRVSKLCQRYRSKLKATLRLLDEMEQKIDFYNAQPIQSQELFEFLTRNIQLPIALSEIVNSQELYANQEGYGLSNDCPQSEEARWSQEYKRIEEVLKKCFREPIRLLKRKIQYDFRRNIHIEDERLLHINRFQKEDVMLNVVEEEKKMIQANISHFSKSRNIQKNVDQRYHEILTYMEERMNRYQTIMISLICLVLFTIGFLPVLMSWKQSNAINIHCLLLIVISLGLFIGIGLIYLFIIRYKMIRKIKRFNHEMKKVEEQLNSSLEGFSQYLSHACNVMRSNSVLRQIERGNAMKKNVLNFHRIDIQICMKHAEILFSKFLNKNAFIDTKEEAYRYDFSLKQHYDYEVPYHDEEEIEFLQLGNNINVPVDFLERVTLRREELYD